MKCPHCNQEIEEGAKFCPFCGDEIPLLKSCPNEACVNYGKKVLPANYKFCPQCRTTLQNGGNNIDWSQLFPVDMVTLGVTNIFEIEPDSCLGIGAHCSSNGYWLLKSQEKEGSIGYHQRYEHEFVSDIYYSAVLPLKWEKILGFNCGIDDNSVTKNLKGKGEIIGFRQYEKNDAKNMIFLTSDKRYLLELRFDKTNHILDFVSVTFYSCPYCHSLDVKLNGFTIRCEQCGFEWGRTRICPNPVCQSENIECSEKHFRCKDCGYEIKL